LLAVWFVIWSRENWQKLRFDVTDEFMIEGAQPAGGSLSWSGCSALKLWPISCAVSPMRCGAPGLKAFCEMP
jgi:hypothetical protein